MMDGFNRGKWFWIGERILFVGLTDQFLEEYKEEGKRSVISSAPTYHTLLDADNAKTHHMADWLDQNVSGFGNIKVETNSLQSYLDTTDTIFDEIYIDGISDKWKYDGRQYDFLFTMVESCLKRVNGNVYVRLNLLDQEPGYNIHYLVTHFLNTYRHIDIEKVSDTCYIFTFVALLH